MYTVQNEFWEFKVLSPLFGLQVLGDCRAGMLRLSMCGRAIHYGNVRRM